MSGKVLLINPPWGAVNHPSIHVGLLKRCLEAEGLACDAAHANLWMLEFLSHSDYLDLTEEYGFLGEWLFSREAFGDFKPKGGGDFWRAFGLVFPEPERKLGAGYREKWEAFRRDVVPRYLARSLARVDWTAYGVVGLTCTFEQVVASLALARRIKELSPGTRIVLGGSQLDHPMGLAYHEAFSCIDHVVMGEGEEVFPKLARALLEGGSAAGLPGVSRRLKSGRVVMDLPPKPVADLDRYPAPDYAGHFETLDELCREHGLLVPRPVLLLETAKGCWWGEKSHCTFCSLTDAAITFRAKSPKRLLAEVREQSRAHGSLSFRAVDSILDKRYLTQVMPALEGHDLDFYLEARADLGRGDLAALARAGVTEFLIGIDSLSTAVLRLMRKGGSMLQNVALLKWARHYGIRVDYNLLYRCPGETAAMYEDMTRLIPKLWHLDAPRSLRRLELLRFSPFHERPEEFGLSAIRPFEAYRHVFPGDRVDLDRIAFIFEADWRAQAGADAYLPALAAAFDAWRQRAPRARLEARRGPGFLDLYDSRGGGKAKRTRLKGWQARLYDFLGERVRSRGDVSSFLDLEPGGGAKAEAALAAWQEAGLALNEGAQWLALALPSGPAALEERP